MIGLRKYIFLGLILMLSCRKKDNNATDLGLPAQVTFTYLPTDLARVRDFEGIGQIRVIPKVHGGFTYMMVNPPNIPVYAMSDGVITEIRKEMGQFTQTGYYDWMLQIAVTKTATYYLGHLANLSSEILTEAGNIAVSRTDPARVQIRIKAGQVIGYIGSVGGFDIGMWDTSTELYFANPSRYSKEYRGTVRWTDYLAQELREQVWQKSRRTVEPLGGRIDYDVGGTVSGNWFLQGAKELTEWSKQLVFARHEIYADRVTIADASPLLDGDGMINNGRESHIWWVVGNSPLPEDIRKQNGLIKYGIVRWHVLRANPNTAPEGTVLVELVDEKTLKYEYVPAKKPAEVNGFSSAAKIYVR